MKIKFIIIFLCLFRMAAQAQEKIIINITDAKTGDALDLVTISSNNKYLATADSAGSAVLTLPTGRNRLRFSLTGYTRIDTVIIMPGVSALNIAMAQAAEALEEVTVVATTRNNRGIENSPLKVEVLGLEELNEEAGIKPGNIASILGDVSGVQIQQSSAVSGNSNVRIQGLGGKYTQILRDGMPLYDGFSGGFGILTIPPLDLKQIELVKGSASTLYGGGAISGLINLVSKRPKMEQELDVLANYTTLKEYNLDVYTAKRNKKFGYNLFAGHTDQQAVDVNKDGFSDVPDNNAIMVHPKLFFYPSEKTVLSVGYSGVWNDLKGGDMRVLNKLTDTASRYYESNITQRHTAEYFLEHYYPKDIKLTIKGNYSHFNRNTTTNSTAVNGAQNSYYNEASVYAPMGKNDLVAGINMVGDNYKTTLPDTALLKTYDNFTLGAFGQYSRHIGKAILETGLRFDHHNRYGLFVLPRVALFFRFNEHWASRAGFGMGYKTPNPLVQQNTDYSTLDLLPLNTTVIPEMSYGYNAEVNYKHEFAEHRSLFINQAFFMTQVYHPILFLPNTAGKADLVNATAPITSKGFDTYVKLDIDGWELYAGYTFTDSRNTYLPVNSFIPLTPRNRGAFVVVKEFAGRFRVGLEGSYTGYQYRYDATKTPAYFFMALMLQYNMSKHLTLVANCENLLDYRMSNVESLYTGTVANPVFKPLWAPIDGRVINFSLRWKL